MTNKYSTVLTILTQRNHAGSLAGDLLIDGQPPDESFRRRIGFCQQIDVQDGTSTIREAFEFSALLRQEARFSKEEKLSYVNTVIHTLGLFELQDAVVGSLPLEQKRRTTIGVELCARPSLLMFLDEPTSVSFWKRKSPAFAEPDNTRYIGTRQSGRPQHCKFVEKACRCWFSHHMYNTPGKPRTN